jgi:exopolysaccharide production protein ExoY
MYHFGTEIGFSLRPLPSRTATDPDQGRYGKAIKRCLDLVLALLALPVSLPVILGLAAIVRFDGGPAFYGHVRIGRNGRQFRCWKLRTMVVDADQRLSRHLAMNPAARAEWDERQKLAHDPRVTRVGRILRMLSLDELPQIWNVLRGDMSLVGPRPVTAGELVRYGTQAQFYLMCRPGITGLWQVMGRKASTYDSRVALDRYYAETLSFSTDVIILFRTIPAVLRLTGT